jgi:hypothetical protein
VGKLINVLFVEMTGFNSGFSSALTPPVPSIPNIYAGASQPPAKSFNPSDIFGQMKSGQFAQNANAAPQDPNKYNALRPQPTGKLSSWHFKDLLMKFEIDKGPLIQ